MMFIRRLRAALWRVCAAQLWLRLSHALPTISINSLVCMALICCSSPRDERCGNGILDPQESCDGTDFGDLLCRDFSELGRHSSGSVACTADCLFDLSGCDPCWNYPCPPYGTLPGETISDLILLPANPPALKLAGTNRLLELSDLYPLHRQSPTTLRALMIFVATGWCPYCSQEAAYLEALSQQLAPQGVLVLSIITEDPYGSSATAEFAKRYALQFAWKFPVSVGKLANSYWRLSNRIPASEQTTSYPFHLFIDAQSMKIARTHIGALTSQEATHYLQQIITRQKKHP